MELALYYYLQIIAYQKGMKASIVRLIT